MIYLKKFTEEIERSIEDWCEYFDLKKYSINNIDNSVDVEESVYIRRLGLSSIPIQFGIVGGTFYCYENKLKSLKGSPIELGVDFNCNNNKLTSLEGSTMKINGNFSCRYNSFKSLLGGPKIVGEDYNCQYNHLISLDGYPKELGGSFNCGYNPIANICYLFKDYKSYKDSLDYNYLRGTNIIKLRFQEALEEAGIEMPYVIIGYKYI